MISAPREIRWSEIPRRLNTIMKYRTNERCSSAHTRQSILDAAEELFVQKGFEGVSLDEIAEASGVKRGAVHFHFLNKAGVLFALTERKWPPFRELSELLERDPGVAPLGALLDVVVEMIHAYQGDERRRAITAT